MPTVGIIRPYQQATGQRRLLADLKSALSDTNFQELRVVVAYAKSGPLHRLRAHFDAWRKAGGKSYAIIGIDQQGTSQEALEPALALFDRVYVTRERGVTFHPKAYIFEGKKLARFFVGSSNLTVGGTETNFEASLIVDLDIDQEKHLYSDLRAIWDELLPSACPATQALTQGILNQLVADGHVLAETALAKQQAKGRTTSAPITKSGLQLRPPTPLPANAKKAAQPKTPPGGAPNPAGVQAQAMGAASGFAIQIKPHANGEIFLSVSAALQNPAFFDLPKLVCSTDITRGEPNFEQNKNESLLASVISSRVP